MRGGHISVSSSESEQAGPHASARAHLRLKKKKMPSAVPPPGGSRFVWSELWPPGIRFSTLLGDSQGQRG